MSGFLSGALAVLSAVQSALPAVVLGDLYLGDFAIPDKITIARKHAVTVHQLPGGARVLDTMGPVPEAIPFSGIFLGPFASVQAAQLLQMLDAGDLVQLEWGAWSFTVLIESASVDTGFNRFDYRVSCIVLPDIGTDEEDDLGDGESPDAPQTAQDAGQAKVTTARATVKALPVPPVPPSAINPSAGPGAL